MRLLKPLIIVMFFLALYTLQVRAQYDFSVDVTEGCAPLKVKFSFESTATADTVATYYWSFGNGTTSIEMDPDTVVFESGGVFDPTLVLVFAGGSEMWIVKPDLITVHGTPPEADFKFSAPTESLFYFVFEQTSVNDTTGYEFTWMVYNEDFDFDTTTGETREIIFPVIDTFEVTMLIENQYGCSSSETKPIIIAREIQIQNVFTPGGDQINDYFIIRSKDDIPLRIKIFSRIGILVYEFEGPVISWNGETASGDKLKTGIYFYMLEAISGDPQKLYTKTGFIHMYRKE